MKILKISFVVLLIIFSVNLVYAQSVGEHYNKGMKYGVAGNFEVAKVEFEKALKISKDEPVKKEIKDYLEIIEDAIKQKIKKETAIHLFKAINYYRLSGAYVMSTNVWFMLDKVISEYKKAITINPKYARAYFNLGVIYYKQSQLCTSKNKIIYWSKLDKAISEFKKVLSINPNYTEAHYYLGRAYRDKGMLDKAIVEYKKAIEINPSDAKAHYNLGLAYDEKGQIDDAIVEYKKAIEINPSDAKAHYGLGAAYCGKGEYELAIKHCDEAVRLGYKVHPDFLKALEPYRKK